MENINGTINYSIFWNLLINVNDFFKTKYQHILFIFLILHKKEMSICQLTN